MADLIRLNLGSGLKKVEGFLNVDLMLDADIVADVRNLDMIEDDYADEILASHIIEHFYEWEAVPLLREWLRVMKPGGLISIECPNIQFCAAMFLHGGCSDRFTMWGLYGDPSHKNPLMCHKWGYTPYTLAEKMAQAGFVEIKNVEAKKVSGRDMRLTGVKP